MGSPQPVAAWRPRAPEAFRGRVWSTLRLAGAHRNPHRRGARDVRCSREANSSSDGSRRRPRQPKPKAIAATQSDEMPSDKRAGQAQGHSPVDPAQQTLEAMPTRGLLSTKHRGWLMTHPFGWITDCWVGGHLVRVAS